MGKGLLKCAVTLAVLLVLLFPIAWNEWRGVRDDAAVRAYRATVAAMDAGEADALFNTCRGYNQALRGSPDASVELPQALTARRFSNTLFTADIPEVGLSQPVIASEDVRPNWGAAALVERTSLPVGDDGDHTVIVFSDDRWSDQIYRKLLRVRPGDRVTLRLLNGSVAYLVEAAGVGEAPGEESGEGCRLTVLIADPDEDEKVLWIRAKRTLDRLTAENDDTRSLADILQIVILGAPVALIGLVIWLLGEAVKRPLERRRLKKLKL